MKNLSEGDLARACLLHSRGRAIRSLAAQFGVPKSTLHYQISKRLGSSGRSSRRHGSIAILEEHLRSPGLSRNQKHAVRRWMTQHFQEITAIDATAATPLMTRRREQALTNAECGRRWDFRGTAAEEGYVAYSA